VSNEDSLAGERLQLEFDRLRAEAKKLQAEAEKLQSEKNELDARLVYDQKQRELEEHRFYAWREHWLPALISLVAIASTIATAAIASCSYLDQRGRQFDYNLSKEAIDLVDKLASANPDEQANAAFLLSAYERYAVPLLLMHLSSPTTENPESTIRALELIEQKTRVNATRDVIVPLLERAAIEFKEPAFDDSDREKVILHLTMAIGRLGLEDRVEAIELLDSLEHSLNEQKRRLKRDDYDPLAKVIGEARQQLSGRSRGDANDL
jgi:hypothetical protein